MKAIAQYKSSFQFTEDSWKTYHPTLEIDGNTTIEQIADWYKNNNERNKMEVTIIELEEL